MPLAFLISWQWFFVGSLDVIKGFSPIILIIMGGFLCGLSIDFLKPNKLLKTSIAASYIALSVCFLLYYPLVLNSKLIQTNGTLIILYLALGHFMIFRLDALKLESLTVIIISLVLLIYFGVLGSILNLIEIPVMAYYLASAVAGYLVISWLFNIPMGNVFSIGCGGAVLAIMLNIASETIMKNQFFTQPIIGVLVVLLVLFSNGTAERLSAHRHLSEAVFYPLILFFISLLPILIGLFISFLCIKLVLV
ncbi:MAG: hypothetical protein CMM25_00745 [Rhodospirillaceae bacterium]|nr:hypothetical protein [Rhodospirillaceae bacterium]